MINDCLEVKNEDYIRLGLKKDPAKWENGLRTDPRRHSFESWYLAAEFTDGSFLSAAFSTRKQSNLILPPNPTVSLDAVLPDGTNLHRSFSEGTGRILNASKELCDVNISGSFLRQSGNTYTLYYIDEVLEITAEIIPLLNMWRPGTGRIKLGSGRAYLNWLVSAPHAYITAVIHYNGATFDLSGSAYMDHIWSDCDIRKYIDHRYLCVGSTKNHAVTASDIILRQEYGGKRISILYAAEGDSVILDGTQPCTVEREDTFIHRGTHRFYDGKFTFSGYGSGSSRYSVQFSYLRDVCMQTVPEPLSSILNLFGRNDTFLTSKSDMTFSIENADGTAVFNGHGLMQQAAYTALPQAEPNELLGSEWPPESVEKVPESASSGTPESIDITDVAQVQHIK